MNLGIDGLSAIVLGGSKGIGLACAQRLTQEGVNVTLVGRTQQNLDQARTSFSVLGIKAPMALVAADISTIAGCERLCDLPASFDIVILSAPRTDELEVEDIQLRSLSPLLSEATGCVTTLTLHFLKGMKTRKFGRVVSIVGTSVKAPVQTHIISNIVRSGYVAATSTLARIFAADGITLNTVLVGATATETLKSNWALRAKRAGMNFEDYSRRKLADVPLGRLGKPEEIASLCAYLCSRDAAFITAQCIVADGGAVPTIF